MKKICGALAAAVLGFAAFNASDARASVVVLDFEGIYPSYPYVDNDGLVLDFYNGGTSSVGTSGANYGISFGQNALALCLNTLSDSCSNSSRGGQGNPDSQYTALFFLEGSETYMNVAAGFETGFSFFYSSLSFSGSVSVYDDLNGLGNLLATIELSPNAGVCTEYGAQFCPFTSAGVLFDGIAKSVSFAGVANQIAFDDITFGSDIPDPTDPTDPTDTPAPAALSLLGLGLAAATIARRRKSA